MFLSLVWIKGHVFWALVSGSGSVSLAGPFTLQEENGQMSNIILKRST